MGKLRKIVYLTEAQKETLFSEQILTVNGVTINYNENDIYVTSNNNIPLSDIIATTNDNNKFLKVDNGVPTWSVLSSTDIPTISITDKTSGTLPVNRGGTGVTTIADIQAGKDGDGNTISSTYLKLSGGILTGDLGIVVGDTDKFLNFWYNENKTAGASWRLGVLGSGEGDANYFIIQSGTNNSSATTWNDVIRIGQNTYDVAFGGNIYPLTDNAKTLGTSLNKWSNIYSTTFTSGGGTMTGKLTFNKVQNAITYTGTQATYDMIKFIDNTENMDGNGIYIGGGGATIIGGGESADVAAGQVSGGNEVLYLCNDADVNIFTNMQDGWASRKTFTFGSNGTLTASTFFGSLNGNAATATKATQDADGNTISSTYLKLSGGTLTGDLNFKTSSADSPDIVWWYGNTNNEQARIWMDSGFSSKGAPRFREYSSDGTSLYSGYLPLGDGTGASGTWGIDISGNSAYAGKDYWIQYPSGGTYSTTTENVTGALKIVLPQVSQNTMMSFDVHIFTYEGNNKSSVIYHISGYEYESYGWYDPVCRAYSEGIGTYTNLTVRFGAENSKAYVTIGETNTVWNYPQIAISDVHLGYSNASYALWGSNWSISFVTTLPSSSVGSRTGVNTQNINITGNAATATNATTATKATQDGSGNTITSTYAKVASHNNLIAAGNEFTFAASGQSGGVWFNYRTAGGTNGNITDYVFGDGKTGSLATISAGSFSGNANSANYLYTYASNGSNSLSCLQNGFSGIPKSVGTAVRLQHGSHDMAFGWFLDGYGYSNAYGGWFVSEYGTPKWVGVDNGTWTTSNFITSSNYTNYCPTFSGSGATGTWPINITGSAGSISTGVLINLLKGTSFALLGTWNSSNGTGNYFSFDSNTIAIRLRIYASGWEYRGNTQEVFRSSTNSDSVNISYYAPDNGLTRVGVNINWVTNTVSLQDPSFASNMNIAIFKRY